MLVESGKDRYIMQNNIDFDSVNVVAHRFTFGSPGNYPTEMVLLYNGSEVKEWEINDMLSNYNNTYDWDRLNAVVITAQQYENVWNNGKNMMLRPFKANGKKLDMILLYNTKTVTNKESKAIIRLFNEHSMWQTSNPHLFFNTIFMTKERFLNVWGGLLIKCSVCGKVKHVPNRKICDDYEEKCGYCGAGRFMLSCKDTCDGCLDTEERLLCSIFGPPNDTT